METIFVERDGKLLKCRVIAELEPRPCACCGKPFYVQDAEQDAKRTRARGVMYCSDRCARRQAQRNFRQRQRESREREAAATRAAMVAELPPHTIAL